MPTAASRAIIHREASSYNAAKSPEPGLTRKFPMSMRVRKPTSHAVFLILRLMLTPLEWFLPEPVACYLPQESRVVGGSAYWVGNPKR